MENMPIYFTDEKWEKIEKELLEIKVLLTKVLATVEDRGVTEEESILSARDVARQLSVDIGTIYTKCAQGTIPHFKIGNRYKFRQAEINEWIDKGSANPSAGVDDYVNRYLQKHLIRG